MEAGSTVRLSKIIFDAHELSKRLVLKSAHLEGIQQKFSQWQNQQNFSKQDFKANACPFIILTKNLKDPITEGDLTVTTERIRLLLRRFLEGRSINFFDFSHRPQIEQTFLFKGEYAGFKLSPKIQSGLRDQFEASIDKLQQENELIDRIMISDSADIRGKFSDKTNNASISRLLANVCQSPKEPQRRIKKLIQKIQILQIIENYLETESSTFESINQFYHFIQQNYDIGLFSKSFLYTILKQKNFRFKAVVERKNENASIKKARVHFYQRYSIFLNDSNTECLYFDWTSFCEGNFKNKIWSQRREKSIVKSVYVYSNLHLFVLLGPDCIQSFQFIRGRLSSQLIFSFLSQTIDGLLNFSNARNKNLVIILDNSALNHSLPLFSFMANTRITLLFTAPNSSFSNPIEMLFAKIKTPLKKVFCLNKYPY